ncbi:bifunctional diaminohydroxyphosphoribosylaminopyrimidine deaminase/5-amino-6-(5-phosphoribosylamino)uracil reductase RibD [Deinococcus sp. QL22]|uniref:bifunctional diaminohydroxyphosphoribosylaminopyrimidine deaminase/5-amino-6-(5-phosphoribosylamino)uracil reductase RibD n=1 Tax=Deinococcus sp. QL22 TaxID=2939437 RepID=UPI0020176394|nr:bifunctional diaminohydroxyphosphoribosylaminopyrimidine deaminase/5-amino-6-(5-phosphoribosylamino)uracil reductase RibD [Deinococcus sp. QL22]UQN10266.1 bifunctional diaminohydroxyphosphoribosylaminopyrimidine deaminase/5-amino-6-(5-phosphoribosylamino)uracil reductase RibD [Deinococcus sp. QL22]
MYTGIHPPDQLFMQEALTLAARGLGRTTPNPPVGCVIVREGKVVGRGFHPRAGEPHAEVFALREAGARARGATAYVTLEPCSHFGHTPPCADALIAAGVSRVVVAALDPNPQVGGHGVERLHAAGIDVTVGVLAPEALRQQAGFRSLILRKRPWVIYKYAMTLDGRVAATSGDSRWISGEAARALVHRWRDELDAVGVGGGTVLADDPRLTTRGVPGGRDPRPVLFDRRGRTPGTARALRPGAVVVTAPGRDTTHLEAEGVDIVHADGLSEALEALGTLSISSLLLEGGPILAGALFAADLIDEVRAFVSPKLLGLGLNPLAAPGPLRMSQARDLQGVTVTPVGPDVLVQGFFHSIPHVTAQAAATCST